MSVESGTFMFRFYKFYVWHFWLLGDYFERHCMYHESANNHVTYRRRENSSSDSTNVIFLQDILISQTCQEVKSKYHKYDHDIRHFLFSLLGFDILLYFQRYFVIT